MSGQDDTERLPTGSGSRPGTVELQQHYLKQSERKAWQIVHGESNANLQKQVVICADTACNATSLHFYF